MVMATESGNNPPARRLHRAQHSPLRSPSALSSQANTEAVPLTHLTAALPSGSTGCRSPAVSVNLSTGTANSTSTPVTNSSSTATADQSATATTSSPSTGTVNSGTTSANPPAPAANSSTRPVQQERRLQIGHFFLHSVGLKYFSFKWLFRGPRGKEKKKIVILKSRRVALARLAIHVLPSAITIFLFWINGFKFVNGPDITTSTKYVLQGAAKLHELAIVGSLTVVVADVLRFKMIGEGVDFGLLASPFSFMGLNFLWSQDLLSTMRHPFPLLTKTSFIALLVLCCGLAAIVGPASALLFLPSKAWLPTGSTDFYFVGTENQLWPQHLNADHLGLNECRGEDPQSQFYCLHGGWSRMLGFVNPQGIARSKPLMGDEKIARNMFIWRPYDSDNGGTDSWASTTHMSTAYHGTALDKAHDGAWHHAKGRQRRLRDAIEGNTIRIRGRIPVVRVVCGPFRELSLKRTTLPFPVIKQHDYWRTSASDGPLRDLEFSAYVVDSRVNATWVSLPSEFGLSTAGLTYITRNNTGATVGCGCTIDARWAQGEISAHGPINSRIWQAMIGYQRLPLGIGYEEPAQLAFFADGMKENLGPTITADIELLKGLTPLQLLSPNNFLSKEQALFSKYSSLDALLLNTRLWDLPWLLSDTTGPILEIEAVVSAYFVNALSRVGWHLQKEPGRLRSALILRMGSVSNDNLLHQNGKNWERPTNISTSSLKQEWFNYTTAWQLNDTVLYLSITILALHLTIALLHSVVILCQGQTSESWDSITELIALAYNSKPKGDMLENCGTGIMLRDTLRHKVKIVAVDEGQPGNGEKVQLIPCGQANPGNNETEIKVGKEYG